MGYRKVTPTVRRTGHNSTLQWDLAALGCMAYSRVRAPHSIALGLHFDSVLRDAEHRLSPRNHCLSSRENVRHCRVFVSGSLGLIQAEQP